MINLSQCHFFHHKSHTDWAALVVFIGSWTFAERIFMFLSKVLVKGKVRPFRERNGIISEKVFWYFPSKLNCKGKGKVHPCTGRTTHRGSRGISLLFLDHGTGRRWRVSVTPRPLFTPGKDQVQIVHEAGWAPGPVWTGAENLAPTGIRSSDRPARSQSLYRLSYPAHK